MRTVGTQARGIRAPIIKQGDDLVRIVVDSVLQSAKNEKYELNDRDVVGITESLVARAQGNYITIDELIKDLNNKFGSKEIGVVFPILSRNRFSLILKAIAKGFSQVYLLLSYPADEVGNALMDIDLMDEAGINPYIDLLSEADYRRIFGEEVKHPFTGIDYVQAYKDLGVDDNISIYFSNNPREILRFTKNILVADIHSRARTKRILKNAGAQYLYGLDEICTSQVEGSGYNQQYGLLGSNVASEDRLKLFPRDGQYYVEEIQKRIKELTGKQIEVLIYGDGAFKDPVAKIWELADPVVSPAYTAGLAGVPNEVKIKYLADNMFNQLEGEAIDQVMKEYIKEKNPARSGGAEFLGTTPRKLTDLLGSLCDLTSGSGDKGTPIVLIQGYFDNYSTN